MSFDPLALAAHLRQPPLPDRALASLAESAGLNAAQPSEQLWYDGWLLRFSPGKARRARSIQALAPGVLPVVEKLVHVQDFYAQRGLPCVMRVTPQTQPADLDAQLQEQGWTAHEPTCVMRLDLTDRAPAVNAQRQWHSVDAPQFAQAVGHMRGSSAIEQTAHAQRLQVLQVGAQRLLAVDQAGQAMAAGQWMLEGSMAGLYDLIVRSDQRGAGLGSELTTMLLASARQAGARWVYLQVGADNHAARALYRRCGFTDLYVYWYRVPPGGDAS
jgi:ribosomal protein S18 acetylase RimI-like enzyme